MTLATQPDDQWIRLYGRNVPVDVLTAVVDGEVAFATIADAAVGRGAVTTVDSGRLGVSAVRVVEEQRRRGHARTLCAALLAWGGERGATRAYVQVLADNATAITLYESMGFIISTSRATSMLVACRACGWPRGTSTPFAHGWTAWWTGWSAATSTCWPCRRPSAPTTNFRPCRSSRPATT